MLTHFTARQDYFTNFEPSQSQGVAKTGRSPRKLTWPAASRTWLVSHVTRARFKLQRWNAEQFRALEISGLNHLATGTAWRIFKLTKMHTIVLLTIPKYSCVILYKVQECWGTCINYMELLPWLWWIMYVKQELRKLVITGLVTGKAPTHKISVISNLQPTKSAIRRIVMSKNGLSLTPKQKPFMKRTSTTKRKGYRLDRNLGAVSSFVFDRLMRTYYDLFSHVPFISTSSIRLIQYTYLYYFCIFSVIILMPI